MNEEGKIAAYLEMVAQLIKEGHSVNFFMCFDFNGSPKSMLILGKNNKEFMEFLKKKSQTASLRVECGLEEVSEIE